MNSTDVALIIGAFAALTPLVKAISQWHIGVKKLSKAQSQAPTLQNQVFQTEKRSFFRGRGVEFWTDFMLLLCRLAMMWVGLWLLFVLINSKEPLTTGSVALIVMSGCLLNMGFPRDSK